MIPNTFLWYATRGAGAVSLVLLSAVVVLGLLTNLRFEADWWPKLVNAALHRNLALLSLTFLGLHIGTAIADPYVNLGGLLTVIVPFASPYRTFWLAMGTIAFDLILALILTSLLRRHIGYSRWRSLHWLAYAAWPVAVVHGLGAGTDAGSLWMVIIAIACLWAVITGAVVRFGFSREEASRSRDRPSRARVGDRA